MRGLKLFDRLKRKGREERGVVLVLVAIMMTVFIGMAAVAVDLGYFYQQQRQAQAAADAAALAGAQDLPGNPAQALADATTYVGKNMAGVPVTCTANQPGICPTTPYNSNSTQIQVTVTQSVPSLFGHIFGITSTNVSATAVAGNTHSTLCATPGNTCYAIFANDSNCASGHYGLQFSGGGNTITGGILSNGNVSVVGGGSMFGPSTFGPTVLTPACTWNSVGGGNTYISGPTAETAIHPWPIDYAIDFPLCNGSACTGPCDTGTTCLAEHRTPSFCTQATNLASTSLTPVSGNIYCAVGTGTGVSANDPSTWNGAISIGAGGVVAEATYVGASVSIGGGGDTLKACGYSSTGYIVADCNAAVPTPPTGNYPLIYATGASGTAISGGGGGSTFKGDLFAPNGTIFFGGGGDTTSFLEANDVNYTGGGLTGDGPSVSGSGSSSSGLASLVQ